MTKRCLVVSPGALSRALLVALLVSAVPSKASADVLLLVDRLTFKYDVTVQALIYGANEEGCAEFIGTGPVEHFEGIRHGSTFGDGDHRWTEEIRSAPRTDYYSNQRFGQAVQGISDVTGGNVFYMAHNAMMDPSGDMNQAYDYQPRADLEIYWKFVVDSDVSLRLTSVHEEGSGSVEFMLTNLTLGTAWEGGLGVREGGPTRTDALLYPGYVYELRAVARTIRGGDGSATSLTIDANTNFFPAPVPEPATFLLFGTGLSYLGWRRARHAKQ